MIVLMDANALINTPFSHLPWRILRNAPKEWRPEIWVPKVSLIEYIAHAQRLDDDLIAAQEAVIRKAGRTQAMQAALAELEARRAGREARIWQEAEAVGARMAEPTNVHYLDIVQRQVERRRPCKPDTGDGFRDTLNWLTVIDIALAYPEHETVWVSKDSDFRGASPTILHDDLLADLEEAGLTGQVSLVPGLHELTVQLLEKYGLPAGLPLARLRLVERNATTFIVDELVAPQLESNSIFMIMSIKGLDEAPEVSLDFNGRQDGAGSTVWEFSVRLTFVQDLLKAEPGEWFGATVQGLVTTDQYDDPIDGELSSIDLSPGAIHAFGESLSPIIHQLAKTAAGIRETFNKIASHPSLQAWRNTAAHDAVFHNPKVSGLAVEVEPPAEP